MVSNTHLASVATLTVIMVVVQCLTEVNACHDGECYFRCVGDGASSGACRWGVCQCRKNVRRSVDSHLDAWPKNGKRSVDSHLDAWPKNGKRSVDSHLDAWPKNGKRSVDSHLDAWPKNGKRSVDSHLDAWPKNGKRSVDSHA